MPTPPRALPDRSVVTAAPTSAATAFVRGGGALRVTGEMMMSAIDDEWPGCGGLRWGGNDARLSLADAEFPPAAQRLPMCAGEPQPYGRGHVSRAAHVGARDGSRGALPPPVLLPRLRLCSRWPAPNRRDSISSGPREARGAASPATRTSIRGCWPAFRRGRWRSSMVDVSTAWPAGASACGPGSTSPPWDSPRGARLRPRRPVTPSSASTPTGPWKIWRVAADGTGAKLTDTTRASAAPIAPDDLHVTHDGSILVAEFDLNRIVRLTPAARSRPSRAPVCEAPGRRPGRIDNRRRRAVRGRRGRTRIRPLCCQDAHQAWLDGHGLAC